MRVNINLSDPQDDRQVIFLETHQLDDYNILMICKGRTYVHSLHSTQNIRPETPCNYKVSDLLNNDVANRSVMNTVHIVFTVHDKHTNAV